MLPALPLRSLLKVSARVEGVANRNLLFDSILCKAATIEELLAAIGIAILYFNLRPHGRLHGLTPDEAFDGAIPDPHCFAHQMLEARVARVLSNQNTDCRVCESAQIEPLTV